MKRLLIAGILALSGANADTISIETVSLDVPVFSVKNSALSYKDSFLSATYQSAEGDGKCYDPCTSSIYVTDLISRKAKTWTFNGGSFHLAGNSGTDPIGGYDVFTYCGGLPVNPFQETCLVDGTIDGDFIGPLVVTTSASGLSIQGVIEFSVSDSLATGLRIDAGEYSGSYLLAFGHQFITGDPVAPLRFSSAIASSVVATPEPASIILLGFVFLALAFLKRRMA